MNVVVDNFIGIFEDAFTKEYCNEVIDYFESMEEVGATFNRQQENSNFKKVDRDDKALNGMTSANIKNAGKFVSKFNEVLWQQAYPLYVNKFDVIANAGPHTNYSFKIQKTDIGGGYHVWHFESDNRKTASRLLVWSLYLNDVKEGGETEFLYYPKRIKPKAGTLMLWPAGFTHAHRGNPPISNTKYIVTGWIEF
jgi:hypothetical protein